MDDRTKCEIYTTLLNSLNQDGELKETISISTYSSQIKLIKHDLASAVESDQETALQMLQILMDNHVHTIQKDVISILKTDGVSQRRKNTILGSVTTYVKDSLKSSNISDLVSLYTMWKEYDIEKFEAILKEVWYDKEYSDHFKKCFLTILIPLVMDTKNLMDSTKVNSIDLALMFASVMPITHLTSEEYNTFLVALNDYIKNISELRDANFVYWHKLWMFLVRLFGKKLHHSMNLVNKLLRVVEHAFRNSSYEQRLKGYDCWKELIDNVALDIQHISSDKQIRLLLTPLRAKFSRQEAVIVKRFEVFIYLIEKLQDRAVLVLKEFLEFCYGEVGENTDPHKAGQGKSLPELWIRSAKVLMTVLDSKKCRYKENSINHYNSRKLLTALLPEFLSKAIFSGHSHGLTEQCLETEGRLKSPLLSGSNISGVYYHVINSVSECCKLLKTVELGQCKNSVLKCLWSSLFKIVFDDQVNNKQSCIDTVGKVLDTFLKDPDPYSRGIACIIFKEALKLDKSKVLDLVLNSLDTFLNIIFSVPLSKESSNEVEKLLAMLKNSEKPSKLAETIFEAFIKYKTLEVNVDFVAEIWIFLSNEMDDYARGNSLDFLVWPASHAHQLSEFLKEVSVYEQYKRLLVPFVERSDELHFALFKHFERTVRNNPHLVKNVVTLVTMFDPKIRNKDITNVTLEILGLILQIPGLDDKAVQREKTASYLKKMYEANVKIIHDEETVKKLCGCAEQLLRSKHYDILTCIEDSLTGLPENDKSIHGKYLAVDFLIDISEKESDLEVSQKIHKIVELLKNVKNLNSKKNLSSIVPLGGRSAKIAHLVKQMPQSPDKTTSPSLRLFGKDIETHSPFKVVGSQLKNIKTTPGKAQTSTPPKKKESNVFIDDDSNSKFVLINSEVKLDKTKLTEHQRETLKKRREDIPALYQDLSQSVSQGLDSNATGGESDVFKKPAEVDDDNSKIITAKVDEPLIPVKDEAKTGEEIDTAKTVEDTQESTEETKDNEARTKHALKKLSMSIVGADKFVAAGSKRKRREKKPKGEEVKDEKDPEEKNRKKSTTPKTKPEEAEALNENDFDSDENLEEVWLRKTRKMKYSEKKKDKSNVKKDESPANETNKEETKVPDNNCVAEDIVIKDKSTSLPVVDEKAAEIKENNSKVIKPDENQAVPLIPQEKEKKNRKRKSLALASDNAAEVRKSRRRSLPTEKLAQSKLFKNSTPARKKNEPTNTQSELFIEMETNIGQPEVTEPAAPIENAAIKRSRKRKRLSSSENDDIIESSQETTISNISATKLRLSVTRRSSVIDKPSQIPENLDGPSKQPPPPKDREEVATEPVITHTNKIDKEPSEENSSVNDDTSAKKRRRGKQAKSPRCTSTEANQDDAKPEPKLQGATNRTTRRRRGRSNVDVDASLDQGKESDVSVDSIGTPRRSRRRSPRKPEKEEIVKDIMDKLKKQVVFPEGPPTEIESLETPQVSNEEEKALDVSTQDAKKTTQSQDTQTQDTESAITPDGADTQVYFDLPQKPKLTEMDREIARMDTASLSLMDLEELKGFAPPDREKTGSDVDKTLTAAEEFSEQNLGGTENKVVEKDGRDNEQFPESEVIGSSENLSEVAETEELVKQLADRDIEVTMEVDGRCSPVRKMPPDGGINIDSPGPLEASLPSSPVTGDTPNRTSELLNNTSDISPIASKSHIEKSSSDDEFVEQRKFVPVALKFDHEDNHDANQQKSPEKGDDAPQKMDETSPEKAEKEVEIIALGSPPKDDVNSDKETTEKSNRSCSWIRQGPQASQRFFNKRKSAVNMSPSASRIKKMLSNVKPPSQSEQTDEVSQEDILTFTREVPSPLALPRGSILKRKHPDTPEDGMSPCAKRKRVNFSDPCTTSKKVFLKDESNPSQCILSLTSEEDIDREFLEVLATNNIADTPQTESDTIETEPSLQINNPLLLRDDIPIYPELADCEEDVGVVSRKLTGPMFVNALLAKLHGKNIKTIGDLAKQSEVAIARLPFKSPMVAAVYKALDNYYHKNFKSKEATDDVEKGLEEAAEKVDVKTELTKVIERARDENVPIDTICSIIFDSADQKQVLTWVKAHYHQTDVEIFLQESDVTKILKHLIKTIGLPKIFEDLLKSSTDESAYYDCLFKQLNENKPLSHIIGNKTIKELQSAIEENIETKKYDKKELLDTCFLPLVTPIDLASAFHKLTVVDISDIVLNRLKNEDFREFTKRILSGCKSPEEVKDNILENYNLSELTSNIVKRGTPKDIMSSFTYLFLSADKDKDDLMHIFRLVSDCLVAELPPSKLMELSIEFQKKIPIKD